MVLLFLPRLASSSSTVDRSLPLQTHDHPGLFSARWNLGDISLGARRNHRLSSPCHPQRPFHTIRTYTQMFQWNIFRRCQVLSMELL